MELVDGITYREWLNEHPDRTVLERLRPLTTVAAALDEMHSGTQTTVPVAHGDVKPSNIIIRADGSSILVDLGLTRIADGTGRTGHSRPYAAPELFQPTTSSTPDADRFAFAATVLHAILGRTPPILDDAGPDLNTITTLLQDNPAIARYPNLTNQVLQALNAQPHQRPQELRDWLTSLNDPRYAQTTETNDANPDPRHATTDETWDSYNPVRRRHWTARRRAAISVAVAVLAVTTTVALVGRAQPTMPAPPGSGQSSTSATATNVTAPPAATATGTASSGIGGPNAGTVPTSAPMSTPSTTGPQGSSPTPHQTTSSDASKNPPSTPPSSPSVWLSVSPTHGTPTSSFTVSGGGCPTQGRQITIYYGGHALAGAAYCQADHTFSHDVTPNSDGSIKCLDVGGTIYYWTPTQGTSYSIHGQTPAGEWASPNKTYRVD
jgi:serine/threonine protein kinase